MCHVVTFHVLSLSFSCPFFCVHLCFICSSALGYLSLSFTLSLCQFVCFVPSSSVYLVMFYLRSSPVSSCYSGLYFVLLCALGLVLFFFFFFFASLFCLPFVSCILDLWTIASLLNCIWVCHLCLPYLAKCISFYSGEWAAHTYRSVSFYQVCVKL